MPRALWTGWVSFGLVSIPIRMFPATVPRDVRFHEFARGSGQRVRHRRVVGEEVPWGADRWRTEQGLAPSDEHLKSEPEDAEAVSQAGASRSGPPDDAASQVAPQVDATPPAVSYDDVVKGYEVAPGRYVMLERDELEALRPTPDRTIHIEGFVELREIDPVYFEKSYVLAPGFGEGVEKAYGLLHAAMDRAGKVAIGRFVMRTREYLAAIRPMEGILGLESLYYADEVRSPAEVLPYGLPAAASDRELKLAQALIDVMAMDWDPGAFTDTYRQRVMDLIRSKAEGIEPVEEVEPAPRPEVADLMAALRASVEEAKDRQRSARRPGRGRRASG